MNAQDLAFFLSTRLVTAAGAAGDNDNDIEGGGSGGIGDDDVGGDRLSTMEGKNQRRDYDATRVRWRSWLLNLKMEWCGFDFGGSATCELLIC